MCAMSLYLFHVLPESRIASPTMHTPVRPAICHAYKVIALIYGLVYRLGFLGILRTMFYMVFVDFVAVGCVVATLAWYI